MAHFNNTLPRPLNTLK